MYRIIHILFLQSLYRCSFDPKKKGWLGPVKSDDTTSKWSKARGAVAFLGLQRKQKRDQIDVASLVRATIRRHTLHILDPGTRHMDYDNELEEALIAPPVIPKPFVKMEKMNQGIWKSPNPLRRTTDISEQFNFHRPKAPDRETLSTAFMSHQAQYMKKVLAEKEKEMKLLQSQLNKFNAETYRLLKELEGYRGKNYDEIFEENEVLKGNIARVSKENTLLHGQLKQRNNRMLNKIAKKENSAYNSAYNTIRRPKTCIGIRRS